MKTSLRQQISLVDEIRTAPTRMTATKIFREWLGNNGYEEPYYCQHYSIVRTTGCCTSCGKKV